MSGCWSVQGKEAGSGEMWTRPMGNMLLGIGHITKNGKVRSYMQRYPDDIYFVAKPSEQTEAEFKMTEMDERGIVLENPRFPSADKLSIRV